MILVALAMALVVSSCESSTGDIVILSGSENEPLEPLFERFHNETGHKVEMHYLGSVDIMMTLQSGEIPADAVWPANSLWITLGDTGNLIKQTQSIFTSPVVFGIRKSKAEELGWVGKNVLVQDVLEAIRSNRLKFMMTSATQSNSGASGYLGFLYALLGNPEVISAQDLEKPELASAIQEIMGGINRSSGSSGWLKELFLNTPDAEAMVNYEALIIEANQTLISQGKEPLYIVYPMDGMVVSDSPLGFNSQAGEEKQKIFLEFQNWLLKPEIQRELLALGRRTGIGGDITGADTQIFNPAWGIDPNRIISSVRLPSADVIERSLQLYQTGYRKPSFTIFAVDYSGSMDGEGERLLEDAMRMLLDPAEARKYLLQAGQKDRWVILPFSDVIKDEITGEGNDPDMLADLYTRLENTEVGGSTDIHSPIIRAMSILKGVPNLEDYIPAIILMTDGVHNSGPDFDGFLTSYRKAGLDVPVFSIIFAEADKAQLEPISELTRGKIFDGRSDLIKAFRNVKGYN